MSKKEFLKKVKQTVLSFDARAEVVLFGSRARGEFQKDSDWDFLILTGREASEEVKDNLRKLLFFLELDTDEIISAIIRSKETWENYRVTPLFKNIQKEGIEL